MASRPWVLEHRSATLMSTTTVGDFLDIPASPLEDAENTRGPSPPEQEKQEKQEKQEEDAGIRDDGPLPPPSPSPSTSTSSPPSSPPQFSGWRKVVRNFAPSWFAVNMGTGIVSILLFHFPYQARWLRLLACVFFAFNTLLFVLFGLVTAARYALYPESWAIMLAHPAQSLFLGCFPMALATLINMAVFACSHWGPRLIYLAWALWWLDALLSLLTCISLPLNAWTRHRQPLHSATAAILLPIVPCVITAGTGSILASALPSPHHAFTTIVASYILWGIGESLAACVVALYFHRLTIHSLPSKDKIVSVFLPVGPLGQGGFALQQLGRDALVVFPAVDGVFAGAETGVDPVRGAEVLFVLSVFFALVMWGFALAWVCYALASLVRTQRFPFNMGWWGLTFPLGVWATCSHQLWLNLHSEFFKVATTITSLAVVVLWFVVAAGTVRLALTGEAFVPPCLENQHGSACQQESHKGDKSA